MSQFKARWYVVSVDGRATLCADEADAKTVEHDCNLMYPRHGPHKAMALGDVAAERERCAMTLQVTRADVSLAAGELSAQEWRTCAAVLRWAQGRIRGA